MGETVVNDLPHEFVDDPIVGLSALVARRDQPQSSQIAELMADDGHRESERLSEITHADLTVGERVDDPHPHGARQRLQDVDGLTDDVDGRDALTSSGDASRVENIGKRWGPRHS